MTNFIKGSVLFFLLFLLSPSAAYANVVINEFVAHPSSGNSEWVEFHNPNEIDISSYWIDDDSDFSSDSGSSDKKSLSGINTVNPQYPFLEFSSFLNNDGDYVVLFSSDGTVVDQYQYTEDPTADVALGRSPNGSGSFVKLSSPTKGSPNSDPIPTPTSTPAPSPTPPATLTPTLTPTKTPTPINSPTPTRTPTPTKVPTPTKTSTSSTISPTKKVSPTTRVSAKNTDKDSGPTAVLGESTALSPTISEEVKSSTPSASFFLANPLASILIGAGSIILISCGILTFYFYKKNRGEEVT